MPPEPPPPDHSGDERDAGERGHHVTPPPEVSVPEVPLSAFAAPRADMSVVVAPDARGTSTRVRDRDRREHHERAHSEKNALHPRNIGPQDPPLSSISRLQGVAFLPILLHDHVVVITSVRYRLP